MHLTVLMIEAEHPEGLSARKLVLETAKHNVLTAYTGTYGLHLLERFPRVDALIVHTRVEQPFFRDLVPQLRQLAPKLPLIALSPTGDDHIDGIDIVLPSHEPQALLDFLARSFGASKSN